MENKFKKVFVVPYFGEFPNYIQLWIDSCGRNKGFTWLILTDCKTDNLKTYDNTIFFETSLEKVKQVFEKKLHRKVAIESPYKLCDFRVFYWLLIEEYSIKYDFWGYCDIDLIFGNLSTFLYEDLFFTYDRIYINGHLSLMKDTVFSKYMFLLKGSSIELDQVFSNKVTLGFDEHYGINKIWFNNNFPVYKQIQDIADIHPSFDEMTLTYLPLNQKKQIFCLIDGGVYQIYIKRNTLIKREFAYIHIQKRKFTLIEEINNNESFIIGKSYFKKILDTSDSELKKLIKNSKKDNNSNLLFKVMNFIRFYKKRLLNEI